MQKGNIGVTTENIFPVIKKFLYSDHEIFLREMVSNAVDATQKLKTLAQQGDFKGDVSDLKVEIFLDKDKGTLTIRDHGIGMTEGRNIRTRPTPSLATSDWASIPPLWCRARWKSSLLAIRKALRPFAGVAMVHPLLK